MTAVAVVGAGPAGLAAAVAASEAGADVTLIEAGSGLGGQFWRHLPRSWTPAREDLLHHRWGAFTSLRDRVEASPRCKVASRAQVWAIDRIDGRCRLHLVVGDADGSGRATQTLVPDALVLATGAQDLTLPFPGWDLPGVFTGGAAQALAKAERVAVGERVVVAGAGPFLFPVAASLAATGARVVEVDEASRVRQLTGWLSGGGAVAAMPHKLGELLGYLGGQVRHRIPYRLGSAVVAAHGADRVEAVTVARLSPSWAPLPGTERTVPADAVAVSHGFAPRLELALAAGCSLDDAGPFSRFVAVDGDQRTSVPGVFAAGEVTGIGGADAALAQGRLAGWLAGAGAPAARHVAAVRRQVKTHRAFQRRLAGAHGIGAGWTEWLTDDTVVCRCEETTYGGIRRALETNRSRGLRGLKLATRAGLGPCQARICGRTVEALVTASIGGPPLDGAIPDRRPLAVPIRLGELAAPIHQEINCEERYRV